MQVLVHLHRLAAHTRCVAAHVHRLVPLGSCQHQHRPAEVAARADEHLVGVKGQAKSGNKLAATTSKEQKHCKQTRTWSEWKARREMSLSRGTSLPSLGSGSFLLRLTAALAGSQGAWLTQAWHCQAARLLGLADKRRHERKSDGLAAACRRSRTAPFRSKHTMRVAANGHVVQQAAEHVAVLIIVRLGDEGAPQHEAQAPEGQHQAQPVALVVLHGEAPAGTTCVSRFECQDTASAREAGTLTRHRPATAALQLL